MTAAERVIAVLRGEVGYIEKRSNAQLDDPAANVGSANYTKYARDLDRTSIFNTPKQGYDWCAVFTVWPYWKLWGEDVARKMLYLPRKSSAAGVDWMVRYFKEAGAFSTTPVIGGPVFFKNSKGQWQHVETVVDVRGDTVYTIGGNTSGGVRVAEKQYKVNDTSIGGYGRPDWAAAPADAETEEDEDMTDAQKEALFEEFKARLTGKDLADKLKAYEAKQDAPEWARGLLREAVDMGLTDGTQPMRYVPRFEAALMARAAAKYGESHGRKT